MKQIIFSAITLLLFCTTACNKDELGGERPNNLFYFHELNGVWYESLDSNASVLNNVGHFTYEVLDTLYLNTNDSSYKLRYHTFTDFIDTSQAWLNCYKTFYSKGKFELVQDSLLHFTGNYFTDSTYIILTRNTCSLDSLLNQHRLAYKYNNDMILDGSHYMVKRP